MSASTWASVVHGVTLLAMSSLAWNDVRRLQALARGNWLGSPGGGTSAPRGAGVTDNALVRLLGELEDALETATSDSARVAALNEATSDFEGILGIVHGGAVAWRVCGASGVAWACLLLARDPTTALGCAVSGAVGGMFTWRLGRMADSRTRELRGRWNGLIRRWSRSFPQNENGSAASRRMQTRADERSQECQKRDES